jgi:HEAT repeat protein
MAQDGAAADAGSSNVAKLTDDGLDSAARVKRAQALANDSTVAGLDELAAGLHLSDEKLSDAIHAALKKRNAGGALLERALDVRAPVEARVNALAGVRAVKPKDAAGKLAPLLTDFAKTPEAVREATAHALCVVEPAAAEGALVQSLKGEPSAKVRYFVALALGELKSAAAKGAVTAALKTEKDFTVIDSLERARRKQNVKP